MKALTAFLACFSLVFLAATTPPNELKEVVIVHGEAGMALGTLDEVSASDVDGVGVVAACIDAQFQDLAITGYAIEGATLYVACANAGLESGTVAFRSEVRSDCPNNSIYQVRVAPAFAQREIDENIKDLLITWTRHRHNTIDAPVKVINIVTSGDGQRYDVQLAL